MRTKVPKNSPRRRMSNADAVARNNGTASFMPPPFQLKGAELDEDKFQMKKPEEEMQMKKPEEEMQMKKPEEEMQMKKPEEEMQMKKPEEEMQMKKPEEEMQMKKPEEEMQMKKPEEEMQMKKPEEEMPQQHASINDNEEERKLEDETGKVPGAQMKKGDEKEVSSNSSTKTQLPEEVQAKMESTMGQDFSNVNIHADSEKASGVGALAYAQGNDVHFAPGQFKPETSAGQELIGHELAHVKQQREGRVQPTTQAKGLPVNDDPKLEKEADDVGKKAAQAKMPEEEQIQKKKRR